jgi:hypothetical protein
VFECCPAGERLRSIQGEGINLGLAVVKLVIRVQIAVTEVDDLEGLILALDSKDKSLHGIA